MGFQYGFGSGLLFGTRTDITGTTPRQFGTLQDISVDFDGEIKELFGQFQFPVDVARGKTKITGKAKFAQISANVYNDLFFGQSTQAGESLLVYNESDTPASTPVSLNTSASSTSGATTLTFAATTGVANGDVVTGTGVAANTTVVSFTSTVVTITPALTGSVTSGEAITFTPPPTVTVANATGYSQDEGVVYAASGNPLKAMTTSSGLTVGQYYVNPATGMYSFSVADSGVAMYISYLYTPIGTVGTTILGANLLMGTTPRFSIQFSMTYNAKQINLNLLQCVSSKLMLPTKLDDYVLNELDFSAFANSAGNVFTLSTVG